MTLSPTLPLLALAALCAPASPGAQCPSFEVRFAAPGPSGAVHALSSFDDGSGARLVAGGAFAEVGGLDVGFIAAWDGERWSALDGGLDGFVEALFVHDFGSGPELVAGGTFQLAGAVAAANVARYDGAVWSPLGAGLDGTVRALAAFDFGAGPELVAAGSFTGSGVTSIAHVARFDGVGWSEVGGGLDGPGYALERFDDGGGVQLVVGGDFTQAGASACAHVARFDGAGWSPLGLGTDGEVRALQTVASGGAQALVLGGAFQDAGGTPALNVARFDGTGFTALGAGLGGMLGQPVLALGIEGSDVVAGGTFDLGGSVNIARFDGATWQPFAEGLGTSPLFDAVRVVQRLDPNDGQGERLFAGGSFLDTGNGLPREIASWDGSAWRMPHDANAQGIVHLPSQSGPVSMTMWQGELVVAGEFGGAGESVAPNAARWNGTTWSALAAPPVLVAQDRVTLARAVELATGPELVLGMMRTTPADVAVPLYRWDGAQWAPFAAGASPENDTRVYDVAVFDDGTGAKLWAAGYRLRADAGALAETVVRWNGTAWERPVAAAGAALDGIAVRLAVHDDGSGDALYVAGHFTGAVRRWSGSSWDLVGSGLDAAVSALREFDDGNGMKLYASGAFQAHQGLARWNGSAWESVPGVGTTHFGMTDLVVFDDGSGAGSRLWGQDLSDRLLVFDGTSWTAVAHTDPYFTMGRLAGFADLPGGPGLVLGGNFRELDGVEQAGFAILRGCDLFPSFCDASDGALASCPCANAGAPDTGCDIAQATGGVGLEVAAQDTALASATLVATGFPVAASPAAVVIRSTGLDPAAPVVFGDGLRCVAAAPLVRLAATTASGGVSTHAIGHGAMAGPGSFHYQVWFRNTPSTYCDPAAAFNLSNGRTLAWP